MVVNNEAFIQDSGPRTSPAPATDSYRCLKQIINDLPKKVTCDNINYCRIRTTGEIRMFISHPGVFTTLSPSLYRAWMIHGGQDMQTWQIASKGKKSELLSHVVFIITEH